jgi:hypothetical protein
VEIEFEFRGERPLAVPAGVRHTSPISNQPLYLHRNVHVYRFRGSGVFPPPPSGGSTAGKKLRLRSPR